jgi:lysyl-tRNA synthetase class 2
MRLMADHLPFCSLDMLLARAELLKSLRRFFDDRGFLEVETPTLSRDSVIDEHLDPLRVTLFRDPREPEVGDTFWLQTSPEFGMKRLLAAGATAIYQITRAYRGGEAGSLHNPEFTMLEWYRVGDDYAAGRKLLAELAAFVMNGAAVDELTYREAFRRYAGSDPFEHSFALDRILTEQVEPNLGRPSPTILYDYPADQSALARVRPSDNPGQPAVAERFELYMNGVELANGYHELLDPQVLRERNQRNNAKRLAAGKYALPEDSRLLSAMEQGLPSCSGCALGVDRLLMVLTGAKTIQEVLAFPIDRA